MDIEIQESNFKDSERPWRGWFPGQGPKLHGGLKSDDLVTEKEDFALQTVWCCYGFSGEHNGSA